MRLSYLNGDSLLNFYELPVISLANSIVAVCDLTHDVLLSSSNNDSHLELFSILLEPSTQQISELVDQSLAADVIATAVHASSAAQSFTAAQVLLTDIPLSDSTWLNLAAFTVFNWNLMAVMLIMFVSSMLWLVTTLTLNLKYKFHAQNVKNIYLIMFIWVFASLDKLESTEEAVSLAILWPWCFLIVFTHLTALADHSILFGFSEWGLPVTYGLIMLAENCWTMGTYIFIYLAGARGRKLSLLVALEDVVALAILVARVLLQAVRGVIVGMFHFISRELVWNMSKFWTTNTYTPGTTQLATSNLSPKYYLVDVILSSMLAGGSFVVITGIMFLQLIFLLVSVWLFCKCWFISWRNAKTTP